MAKLRFKPNWKKRPNLMAAVLYSLREKARIIRRNRNTGSISSRDSVISGTGTLTQ